MQNLKTHSVSYINLTLCPQTQSSLALFETPSGVRKLCFVLPTSANELTLHTYDLPPSTFGLHPSITIPTALPAITVGLCIVDGLLLIATCAGELFRVDPSTGNVEPVGDVVDDDEPAHSGVLAVCASPDGNLVVVVSPVKTLVLDAALDLRAERPHAGGTAKAAKVAWRADGEFFVVAVERNDGKIGGCVVDRECASVKELDVNGLDERTEEMGEVLVAWEPRVGGFICLSTGGGRLVFFERNGLRHLRSDFELHCGSPPSLLTWSVDSRMLTVVQPGEEGESIVSVFTRCNYNWYCKKCVRVKGEVVSVHWDEDVADAMAVFTKEGLALFLKFRAVSGSVFDVSGGAHAFVVDARNVCVTNFSHAALPPPMNHGVVGFVDAVEEVCAWEEKGRIGALLANGEFEVLQVGEQFRRAQVECSPKANGDVSHENRRWRLDGAGSGAKEVFSLRSPVFVDMEHVVILDHSSPWSPTSGESSDIVRLYRLDNESPNASCLSQYVVDGCVRVFSRSVKTNSIVLATSKGSVVQLAVDLETGEFTEMLSMPSAVSEDAISICDFRIGNGRCLTLVHDDVGVLKLLELSTEKSLFVSRECTSFCLQEGFLSFTTLSHLMYCVLLDTTMSKSYDADKIEIPSLADALDGTTEALTMDSQGSHLAEGKGATRPIDRGSLIVTAVPRDVAVVMQAPRGNLETICPRPIVFEAVDKFAKSAAYAKAFSLCRKQRVDMNHLVDANYDLFLENVRKFVDEVDKSSHLSIFMTFLRGERAKVNAVCDAIVNTLKEKEESGRYFNALLTGLIRREPSDFEGALGQVRQARERSEEDGTSALDYLFVLIKDEEKVYGEALGTYDLKLALFVARSSQMDPAEYSLELKSLSLLDERQRKHAIDMRLARYDKALRHLHACGEGKYAECIALCHEHALYETALELFQGNESYIPGLLNGFGKHLHATSRFEEAGASFIRNGDWEQASASYRSGGLWQLAASAAWRCETLSVEEKHGLLESLAEELTENGKVREAARVRLTHLGDVDGAIELLSGAEEWEELFEAVATHCARQSSLENSADCSTEKALWDRVAGLVVEGAEAILSTIRENRGKLHERRKRLETVREAKREISLRLAAKGLDQDEGDSDVFSASTASSLVSNLSDVTFTSRTSATSVYTTVTNTGPLSAGKLEKQAEKRRRKAARKRIREGHPREEEYLVGYLRKLVPNAFLRKRVRNAGKALMFVGRTEVVSTLVTEMTEYAEEAGLLPDDVLDWEELREGVSDRSWLEHVKFVEVL